MTKVIWVTEPVMDGRGYFRTSRIWMGERSKW